MGIGGIIGTMGAISYDIVSQDKTKEGIASAKSGFNELTIAAGVMAGAIVAAGTAAYMAIEKYGGMAQQLKDLSYQTGINTTTLQQMQYAAMLSGTSFDKVAFGLNTLSVSMAKARDTESEFYKAFTAIGVDPRGRTVDQVFDLTARALYNMRDETQRNQAAMTLYGRSWRDLLPYMDTYIKKSDEIKKHPVLSQEDLQTLQDGKVAIDKLTTSLDLYLAKLVVAAEKQFNFNKITGRGITEIKGDINSATETMEKLYGSLNEPLPEITPPDLTEILKKQEEAERTRTDAAKDFLKVLEDINEAKKENVDMETDFQQSVLAAGRSVGQIRTLVTQHGRDERGASEKTAVLESEASMAGSRYAAAGGTVEMFAGATINVTLSKDYPWKDFVADVNKEISKSRQQQGVRTAR